MPSVKRITNGFVGRISSFTSESAAGSTARCFPFALTLSVSISNMIGEVAVNDG